MLKSIVIVRSPNDLIDLLIRKVSEAEISKDYTQFVDIRRMMNTDLRQAIDEYAGQVKVADG